MRGFTTGGRKRPPKSLPPLYPKAWLALALALAGCGAHVTESDPAMELARACVEAGGEHEPEVAAELRTLCDPSAIRGRSPEQQWSDAERVRELTQ